MERYSRYINVNKIPKKNIGDRYDWINSIGVEIEFKYDDIEGIIKISKNIGTSVIVEYLGCEYKIGKYSLLDCRLGIIVGKISMEYRYEIGDRIKDNKRDLTIIDKIIITGDNGITCRGYKYKCNKCGFNNGKIRESCLYADNVGCSCCAGNSKTILFGVNDFYSNYPELAKHMENPEHGKEIACNTLEKIRLKCPDCGTISEINISYYIKRGSFSCIKCGDGISYPNKFIYNMFEQLNIDFINEKSFDWSLRKRYDFYIPSLNCIVEAHGQQHYTDSGFKNAYHSNDIENDKIKRNLALGNKISYYIEIDCSKSDMIFIKNNVLNSDLSKLFDLSCIEWESCNEYSTKSVVKKVCEFRRDNPDLTISQIGKKLNIPWVTCIKYIKRGNEIWDWVNYDPKLETIKNIEKSKIRVELFDNYTSVGIFNSIKEMIDKSVELFGIKFDDSSFRKCMKRNKKYHGRFTYKKI